MKNKATIVIFLFCALAFNANAQTHDEFSLPDLINKAIAYHPSIKSSIFLEDSAQDDVTSAKWRYFPTPQFSISQVDASTTDIGYSGDDRTVLFGFSQPLWAGGAIEAGLANSTAKLIAAREATRIAQRELSLKVIEAYSRWYESYLKKEAYSKSKKEHDMLSVRLKRRIEQGLSSKSDFKMVTSRANQSGAHLNSALVQHKNALRSLEELLGLKLDPEALIENFYIIEFNNELEALKRKALLVDPEIKKIKAESKALKAELKQSKANLYPGVNLKVERQWGNFVTSKSSPEDRIFLELNSSFGPGLSNFSQIKQIKNRYESLQSQMQDVKNKLEQKIELDWASAESLKNQQTLLLTSLSNTKEVQKSWYRQFLAGRKQWQDVMASVREVSQLEAQLAGVYAETTSVNWRIFVYAKQMNDILNPFSNTTSKMQHLDKTKTLWHPNIEKTEPSIADTVLNFAFPENETEGKVVWYADVGTHQKIIKTVHDNGFGKFIKKMDNWLLPSTNTKRRPTSIVDTPISKLKPRVKQKTRLKQKSKLKPKLRKKTSVNIIKAPAQVPVPVLNLSPIKIKWARPVTTKKQTNKTSLVIKRKTTQMPVTKVKKINKPTISPVIDSSNGPVYKIIWRPKPK